MKNIFLAEPSKKYEAGFQNYVLAYGKANDSYYFNKYKKALENFEAYLIELQNASQGINLSEEDVRTSSFWLIQEEEVVGVVRVRHQEVENAGHIGYDIAPPFRKKGYGTAILKLALEKAYGIGLKEVIVTCNIYNIASKRIIEKNKGRFLETIFDKEENEELYKYAVQTAQI